MKFHKKEKWKKWKRIKHEPRVEIFYETHAKSPCFRTDGLQWSRALGQKRINLTLNQWDNFMHSMSLERGGKEETIRQSLAGTERGRICLQENAIIKGKLTQYEQNMMNSLFCSMALCLLCQSLFYHYLTYLLSTNLGHLLFPRTSLPIQITLRLDFALRRWHWV